MATLKSPRTAIKTYQQQKLQDGIPENWQMRVIFEKQDQLRLNQLMRIFCSAERMAYSCLRKKMKSGDIYRILLDKFVLSGRYANDAIFNAQNLVKGQKELLRDHIKNKKRRLRYVKKRVREVTKPAKKRNYQQAEIRIKKELQELKAYKKDKSMPPAIFGGKKRFQQRLKGTLSAEEWRYSRMNHLATQGEISKDGNLITRIMTTNKLPKNHSAYETDTVWLRVSIPVVGGGQSDYIYGQVKLSPKLPLDLLILKNYAYGVRLIRKKETSATVDEEFQDFADYKKLNKFIESIGNEKSKNCNKVFYLAVLSEFFEVIVNNLKKVGLAFKGTKIKSYNRVVFEKPFGHDLKSAKQLNDKISHVFNENQIFRIDHYLAKELVQNLLILRFANSIFEPLWNKKYIDHVQITVAEDLGVETRGGYYDKSGALRDIMQNHMLQLVALVAMELPVSLNSDDIREEKVKVLRSIETFSIKEVYNITVRGQYDAGSINNKKVKAYRGEEGVSKNSSIETFAALKIKVDNLRWSGIPFYLRTGKRLKERVAEISIVFKSNS